MSQDNTGKGKRGGGRFSAVLLSSDWRSIGWMGRLFAWSPKSTMCALGARE